MKIIEKIKTNSYNKYTLALIGAIIGFIVFILIYGFNALNPLNEQFVIHGYLEKDIAQHYAGWQLYRNSPWQFPLGVGSNIEFPYGSSVSYTDSIPLFAILFKIISPILPATFQYFGLFVMLCFILQGAFGALIVSIFSENKIFCSISSLFFVLSPVMIDRAFRHCALSAHFLILASIYYYFKNTRNNDKSYIPFYIINAVAITIHPYFLPFTFAIMFAFALEDFFIYKNKLKSIIHIFLSIATTLLIGYIIGAFYNKGGMSALGYGYFSMNLNSYFNPISVNFDNWSKFLNPRPVIGGQVEGFNYLGISILIITFIGTILTLIKNRKDILNFIKNYFGIIFSAICLLIFAVGNILTYGGLQLFKFPISENIIIKYFNIFRANGRFGWLLFYLFFIFAIYCVQKYANKNNLSIIIISLFIVLQIIDISDVLINKHQYFYENSQNHSQNVELVAKHPFWEETVQKVDGVLEMESEQGYMFGNGLIDIASMCGKYSKYINSTFAARTSVVKRKEFIDYQKSLLSNNQPDNLLYVVEETKLFDNLIQSGICQSFEVDRQLVVIPSIYSEDEINNFINLGNFKQIIIQ